MESESQLVSVITPTYHAEGTIATTVKSILAQTYTNWEMQIIADDGVDYEAVLANQGIRDPRIHFLSTGNGEHAYRTGSCARNIGLDAANGNIIAIIDADDTFSPGKLARCVPMLEEAPVVTCGLNLVDVAGKHLCNVGTTPGTTGLMKARDFLKNNFSSHTMLVYDRSRIGEIRYDESLSILDDYEFTQRCFEKTPTVFHIAEPLQTYVKDKPGTGDHSEDSNPYSRIKNEMIERLKSNMYQFPDPDAKAAFMLFNGIMLQAAKQYDDVVQADPLHLFEDVVGAMLARINPDIERAKAILGNTEGKPRWIEPPSPAMFRYIPEIREDETLAQMISAYHEVPKDSYDGLPKRCQCLEDIASYIDTKEEEGTITQRIRDIQCTVTNKREYLLRLQTLHEAGILVSDERIYDPDKVVPYFNDFDYGCGYTPLFVNEDLFYDTELAKFWGDYKLECVDPAHRLLEHYKEKWLREYDRTQGDCLPFFLWLEMEEVPPTHRATDYLAPNERDACRLNVREGKLCTGNGSNEHPLSTDLIRETAFVITCDPYTYKKEILSCETRDDLRHASLALAKPLIGIGTWVVQDGVVTELRSFSGHYLPYGDKQTIEVLEEMGVDLRDKTPYHYFKSNVDMVQTTIGAYMGRVPDTAKGDTRSMQWAKRFPAAATQQSSAQRGSSPP